MIDLKIEAEKLKAIAHPVRLKMVIGLCENECNVNKIVNALKMPQSTVSQHLGILKKANIIEARKDGVKTCYRVVDKKIKKIVNLLKNQETI